MSESSSQQEKTRAWQVAFLTGIAGLILSAVLVFGLVLVTGIVTASALIFGAINGLLKPQAGNSSPSNPLLSKLKSILNVSGFLKFATVLIWFATLGVTIYGAIQYYLESKKITLQGTVITAGGAVADNAIVILHLSTRQEVTRTVAGRFIFTKIDVSKEPSKKLSIQVQWQNTKINELLELKDTIDTSTDLSRDIVLKLPPGISPLRVTYIRLEDYAVTFLVKGKIAQQWDERLSGKPFVVPNDTYKSLSYLINRFSNTMSGTGILIKKKSKESNASEQHLELDYKDEIFVGSIESNANVVDTNKKCQFVRSLEDTSVPWRIFAKSDEREAANPVEKVLFRKPGSRDDLNSLSTSPYTSFLLFITEKNMPPEFGYVQLEVSGECGDAGFDTHITFYCRRLCSRLALLENISREPVKIGKFTLRENKTERLRRREEDQALLDTQTPTSESLFPLEVLKPGERIVVPTEMVLTEAKDIYFDDYPPQASNIVQRPEATRELLNTYALSFPIASTGGCIANTNAITNILNRADMKFALDDEFLYGPSIRVESIEIDGVEYALRQFDPSRVIIADYSETGSCPYLYTYSPQSESWINEGVILYGRNGKHRESLDQRALRNFDGRIMIKEKDAETSFIDSVYIRAFLDNGSETNLYPRNRLLRSRDKTYLKLEQGQDLVVNFDFPTDLAVSKYMIVVEGYYVPYRHLPARRSLAIPFP